MTWSLKQIAEWTNAEIISEKQTEFSEIGTDTRKNLKGQVFIALKGDNFDAHDYLDKAVQQGAGLLIVHRIPDQFRNLSTDVSILKTEDTLKALQDFAKGYRQTLNTKIIGITGSNGKTTTKEFTAQVLTAAGKRVHYSHGSFNNHWGVPMTLLSIPQNMEFAVVEMGMNHAGELTELVKIGDPDIVVCTMVGMAHIEFFGTKKKIAEAKSEIYMTSRADTVRIFNQDQEETFDMMYPVAKTWPESRMLSFSEKNPEADVFLKIDELKMKEMKVSGVIAAVRGSATIPIFGKQNLTNLLAAANIAYACGIKPEDIWKALPSCKTSWGRNQFINTAKRAEILFDGYNANPDSMRALIENIPLLKAEGKKIGVFGQMKELGDQATELHIEIGTLAGKAGFDQIFFIGENHHSFAEGIVMAGFKGKFYHQPAFDTALGEKLGHALQHGDIVTIKGSRGAQTERFIPFCDPIDWKEKS